MGNGAGAENGGGGYNDDNPHVGSQQHGGVRDDHRGAANKVQAVNAFNNGNRSGGGGRGNRTQEEEDEEEWLREKERLSQRLREKKEREERERQERQGGGGGGTGTGGGGGGGDHNNTQQPQQPRKKKLLNGNNIEYRYPSGSVYVGAFKDGKLHGFGKYKYHPSGDEYEGEWVADMKHGHGVYTYEGGDKYIGEWRAGKKHGKGTYTFTSGDEYVGSWKDDKIHGHGTFLIARNGNRYEGSWEESYRHGFGVLKSGNGDLYEGNWTKGKEDGQGVLTYANENRYAGDWKAGQMDGKGVFVEKGQKFLVEHISGYLIAKVPVEADAEVDPDWNPANKLYLKHLEKERLAKEREAEGGSPTSGGGGPGNAANEEAFIKMRMERDMYEQKYKDLVAQKTGTRDLAAEAEDENDHDPESLKKKLFEAREQRDVEKQRADDAEAKERIVMAELQEIKFASQDTESLRRENAKLKEQIESGGGSTVSQAEQDRLQRRCADLEKELQARKQQMEGKGGGGREDPIELKVKLELMEGELKMLRTSRDDLQKLREQHLDSQKTIMQLETRNEELIKEVNVQRQRASNLNTQMNDMGNRANDEQAEELKQLRQELQDAKVAIAAHEEDLKKAKKKYKNAEERARKAAELEVELVQLKQNRNNSNTLNDKKSDQVERLEAQNAELQRKLEELQHGDGSTSARGGSTAVATSGGDGGASAAQLKDANTKLESLQADYKKEKKKHKKAAAERDDLNGQVAALKRDIQKMNRTVSAVVEGKVMVHGLVRPLNQEEEARGDKVVAGITPGGEAIFVKDDQKGLNSTVALDTVFPPGASVTDMFDDCRPTIRGACNGFNAALVTYGAMSSGKTTVFSNLAPLGIQELFKAGEVVSQQRNVSFTVRASCVEATCDGTFDLNNSGSTGSDLQILKDQFGAVVLDGVNLVEIPSARDAVVQFKGALQRRRKARSHFIFTLHVTVANTVTNATMQGKLILADLAGMGALGEQDDVESARFVNKGMQAVGSVFEALSSGPNSSAVPYCDDVITMLLCDALGGSCRTHIFAIFSPSSDCAEGTAQALSVASQALKIVNRPQRQAETADVARLRQLVQQCADPGEDRPRYTQISNLRD